MRNRLPATDNRLYRTDKWLLLTDNRWHRNEISPHCPFITKTKNEIRTLLLPTVTNRVVTCTIASKINVTIKGAYLPISKPYIANFLAHNNISEICYCVQISLQSAAVNCSFSDNLTPLGGNIYFAGNGTYFFARTRWFLCWLWIPLIFIFEQIKFK